MQLNRKRRAAIRAFDLRSAGKAFNSVPNAAPWARHKARLFNHDLGFLVA
jgi:hypothetical protein